MICEFDIGNTNCKWRILSDTAVAESGVGPTVDCLEALQALGIRPQRVRIASVAGEDTDQRLSHWIESNWQIAPEFAATQAKFAGLAIAYDDPARLGVDRWLAMLAAFAEFGGPLCVLDLGSAVTVDLLDASGTHIGGYIVPGLALQQRVLVNETGRIRMDESIFPQTTNWGKSSEECISFGVHRMLTAFIASIFSELEDSKSEITVCVAGGGASLVLEGGRKGLTVIEKPDLVLDGLAIALP